MVERRMHNRSIGIRPTLFTEDGHAEIDTKRILHDLERRGRGRDPAGQAMRPTLRAALWGLGLGVVMLGAGGGFWLAGAEDPIPLADVITQQEAAPPLSALPEAVAPEPTAAVIHDVSVAAGPEAPLRATPERAPEITLSEALEGRAARPRPARPATARTASPVRTAEQVAVEAPFVDLGSEPAASARRARESDVVLLSALVAHAKAGREKALAQQAQFRQCMQQPGKSADQCRLLACRDSTRASACALDGAGNIARIAKPA
jgi:hypothetical protein